MGGATLILLRLVVACRPGGWPVRRSGTLVRAPPPVATPVKAGGWGRGGTRRADLAASPPGRHGSFWEGGKSPPPRGGRRAGAPAARRPGGSGGERGGEGGARRCSPPPCPVGWPVAPVPVTLRLRRAPLGYTGAVGVARRPWAPGAARSAAGGSVWQGGGEVSSPRSAPPPSPG